MIVAYAPAIHDALSRENAPTEELLALRQHAHAILHAQGDLRAALDRLEAELERRGAAGA